MALLFQNYNGSIVPAGQQVLQLSNSAFQFGDGVFETMRMVRGNLQFAAQHAKRLQQGMKALYFDNFAFADAEFLREKARELATRNKAKNGLLRLTVFRERDGMQALDYQKFGYAIQWETIEDQQYTLNARGLIVNVYEEIFKPINLLSNHKTCNAINHVLAGIFKQKNRLNDAFLLNQNGFLCESTNANIFIKYQGTLYTPALSEGCIKGVMRQVVIDLALKNSIPVTEAQINPQILNEAEEVFLTNATQGIQWVLGFNRKRYFYEYSRLLSLKLNEQLNESF